MKTFSFHFNHFLKSFILLISISACASVGKPFEFAGPKSIEIGKTTQADLIHRYGEPFRVGYEDSDLKWTYGYYKYRLFGDSDTTDLMITFDKNGKVKSYTYSSTLEAEKKKTLNNTLKNP